MKSKIHDYKKLDLQIMSKKITFTLLMLFAINVSALYAQETRTTVVTTTTTTSYASERYGNTLNTGLGVGYYGYVGHTVPVISLNYEFDVVKNFTLAPFIAVYTYQNTSYWGDPRYPYRNYTYRQTVIPIGVKGTYYFDQILDADDKWDFYLAGSLGFAIRKTTWDNGYYGQTYVNQRTGNLFLDLHIGAEYRINNKIGMFLDLSTGISTVGLAFHL